MKNLQHNFRYNAVLRGDAQKHNVKIFEHI